MLFNEEEPKIEQPLVSAEQEEEVKEEINKVVAESAEAIPLEEEKETETEDELIAEAERRYGERMSKLKAWREEVQDYFRWNFDAVANLEGISLTKWPDSKREEFKGCVAKYNEKKKEINDELEDARRKATIVKAGDLAKDIENI